MMEPPTVAVIGFGALGLVAVENLSEEGFAVTGLERNGFVGGLWHYSDGDLPGMLAATVTNLSVERSCFTDFPFPEGVSSFPRARTVEKYLEDYADHFNLRRLLRLSTPVRRVTPPDKDGKSGGWWADTLGDGEVEYFDKVAMATGINQVPVVPEIRGIEGFGGRCLHSRAYKRPGDFKGRRVLLVGLGNTGEDIAATLVGHPDRIYASHRAGSLIIPRMDRGKPYDHGVSFRAEALAGVLGRYLPRLTEWAVSRYLRGLQDRNFALRLEWGFSLAHPFRDYLPIISDDIVQALEEGSVESVTGVGEVVGPEAVDLTDGTRISVDAIIYCTGPHLFRVFETGTRRRREWAVGAVWGFNEKARRGGL